MVRNSVFGAVIAALFVVHGGCTSSSTSGGETHWLGECATDADCGGGRCLCGICTRTCNGDADCRGSRPAQCFETDSPGLVERCAGKPAAGGVCLAVCSTTSDCPKGGACHLGACVADAMDASAAEVMEGGATDASTRQLATKYVHVDAGVNFQTPVDLPEPSTRVDGADDTLLGLWAQYESDGTRCTPDSPGDNWFVCMQLELARDASSGGIVGHVHWLGWPGAPDWIVPGPFAPPTDPNHFYPVEVSVRHLGELVMNPWPGVRYRVLDGHVDGDALSFWVSFVDPWTDWCAMQTPYPFHLAGLAGIAPIGPPSTIAASGFRCVPQSATQENTDLGKLALCSTAQDFGSCDGVDCPCANDASLPLCGQLTSLCYCTATRCSADLQGQARPFRFTISGTTMHAVAPDTDALANLELRRVSP